MAAAPPGRRARRLERRAGLFGGLAGGEGPARRRVRRRRSHPGARCSAAMPGGRRASRAPAGACSSSRKAPTWTAKPSSFGGLGGFAERLGGELAAGLGPDLPLGRRDDGRHVAAAGVTAASRCGVDDGLRAPPRPTRSGGALSATGLGRRGRRRRRQRGALSFGGIASAAGALGRGSESRIIGTKTTASTTRAIAPINRRRPRRRISLASGDGRGRHASQRTDRSASATV